MSKFVYLLGAGASHNALPLNKRSQSDQTSTFYSELKAFRDTFVHHGGRDSIVQEIDRVLEICKEMGTPDLCAKFLLETGDEHGYKLLTLLLSNYFTYKQFAQQTHKAVFGTEGKSEIRALTFLTTIASNRKLPDNVKIISWNYDSQIEIAADKLRLIKANSESKIIGFSAWPNIAQGETRDYIKEPPFLFHMNGVAGYTYSAGDLAQPLNDFYNFDDNAESLLSFAWEDNENANKHTFTNRRLSIAKRMIEGAEFLIVIGYSFPFFNRRIDKEILDALTPSLTRIYIQDPSYEGDQLRSQFNLHHKIEIWHVRNVDNYFIPYQL